jgi:hypothetical protein
MASANSYHVPPSILAYAGSILFVTLFASILLQAPAPFSSLLGLACHLILLPVVATLQAPAWARAAGYGWLIVDVALNVAAWNIASFGFGNAEMRLITATFDSMRQGIHVSAGIWIAAASLEATGLARATGILAAAFLIGFALLGPFLPDWAIYPGYAFLIVWLALVGRLLGTIQSARSLLAT